VGSSDRQTRVLWYYQDINGIGGKMMRNSSHTLAAVATGLLLALGATVAQEIGPPSDTEITTADCEAAWAQASASASCTTTVLEAETAPGSDIVNNCAVKANCATTLGGEHDNFSDYHGGPAGVVTLLNCSGELKTEC